MANYSTDADLRPYEDIDNTRPRTRLDGAISSDATSITVDAVEAFPDSCTITIESEQLTVTARDIANLTMTVTRGANSTTNAAHADDKAVMLTNFDFVHAEAKRAIDEFLVQNGYDPNWEFQNLPKIFDVAELKTPSVFYALFNLANRQQTGGTDTWNAKASWYLKRYKESIGEIKPKVILLPHDFAVWAYDTSAATYTNRTAEANSSEGTPFTLLASTSDYTYFGADYLWAGLNARMAGRATMTSVWEYWDGNSWETLTVTDQTSNFTNVIQNEGVSWSAPSDWTPYSLSGGVDSRSRYWVRLGASALTVAGTAWYCGQSIVTPYRMQYGGGSGVVGLAS